MKPLIVSVTLLALVGAVNPIERPVEPVEATAVQEQPKVPKQTKKPKQAQSKPEKANDPQGCEPEQYWAAEPPHDCIDKPKEQVVTVARSVATPSGNCHTWMKAAGITNIDIAYQLIMRESGCNPNAVNPSSGACGIGQQLPCGKWPHTWNDPVGAMKDMQSYVKGRYGSWVNAWAFWQANHWY